MDFKWLLNLICTKYGQVTDGKYKGCGMGIGSDDKGVSVNVKWTKFLFIKGTKLIEEVRIENLKYYKILRVEKLFTEISLTYSDGEKSVVKLPAVDSKGNSWNNDRIGLILDSLSSVSIEE